MFSKKESKLIWAEYVDFVQPNNDVFLIGMME